MGNGYITVLYCIAVNVTVNVVVLMPQAQASALSFISGHKLQIFTSVMCSC